MPDILDPLAYSVTLQSYITDAQRLLHDATYKFYSLIELTDYVNKARRLTAAVTGCTRQLIPSVDVDADTASIATTGLLSGRRVIGLLDVYHWYSASTRPPLAYYPYSQFARTGTVMSNYSGTPAIWSQINGTLYISPKPSVATTMDFDAAVEPLSLAELTDADNEIVSPFSECVKFYMCYLAKLKDGKRAEAEAYRVDFYRECSMIGSATNIRKLVGK